MTYTCMNGILVVDKPQGWTSHDVVSFIRRRFNIKKAGHTGTLDPMATGVLVVLLGRCTKLSESIMAGKKEYETILTLGKCTDTQDATGKVTEERPVPELKKSDIEKTLKSFTGEIQQIPPMVSALKVNGQTLYKLARSGKTIDREPRNIMIERLELKAFNPPDISMTILCQKGTYVRTLCEDIARELGACGHMSYLRRTRSGDFNVDNSVNMETLKNIAVDELEKFCVKK